MASVNVLLLLVLVKKRQNLQYTTKTVDYKVSRCIWRSMTTTVDNDNRRDCWNLLLSTP